MYYREFIAEIHYISRVGCFYGEVINIKVDLIVFLAEYKKDLEIAFKMAVEQYLSIRIINHSYVGFKQPVSELL